MNRIDENIKSLKEQIPANVKIVAAVKTRSSSEVESAVAAGINILGHNYVQEGKNLIQTINCLPEHHLIGHLQKNKAKYAVDLFSCIQSVDSAALADVIERRCDLKGKKMDVMIQINSGDEESKSGTLFKESLELAGFIDSLQNLRLVGLMTIEPYFADPAESVPFFRKMKLYFDKIRQKISSPNDFTNLSMGMSNTYLHAIEEGANMIRLGTGIFGARCSDS